MNEQEEVSREQWGRHFK